MTTDNRIFRLQQEIDRAKARIEQDKLIQEDLSSLLDYYQEADKPARVNGISSDGEETDILMQLPPLARLNNALLENDEVIRRVTHFLADNSTAAAPPAPGDLSTTFDAQGSGEVYAEHLKKVFKHKEIEGEGVQELTLTEPLIDKFAALRHQFILAGYEALKAQQLGEKLVNELLIPGTATPKKELKQKARNEKFKNLPIIRLFTKPLDAKPMGPFELKPLSFKPLNALATGAFLAPLTYAILQQSASPSLWASAIGAATIVPYVIKKVINRLDAKPRTFPLEDLALEVVRVDLPFKPEEVRDEYYDEMENLPSVEELVLYAQTYQKNKQLLGQVQGMKTLDEFQQTLGNSAIEARLRQLLSDIRKIFRVQALMNREIESGLYMFADFVLPAEINALIELYKQCNSDEEKRRLGLFITGYEYARVVGARLMAWAFLTARVINSEAYVKAYLTKIEHLNEEINAIKLNDIKRKEQERLRKEKEKENKARLYGQSILGSASLVKKLQRQGISTQQIANPSMLMALMGAGTVASLVQPHVDFIDSQINHYRSVGGFDSRDFFYNDGTPHFQFETLNGGTMGDFAPAVNINGAPMHGGIDIHGNPFGVTNDMHGNGMGGMDSMGGFDSGFNDSFGSGFDSSSSFGSSFDNSSSFGGGFDNSGGFNNF